MNRLSAMTAAVGLAAGVSLTGCSGGDDVASTSTTAPVAAVPPSTSADEIDPCALITPQEAADALDAPSTITEAWSLAPDDGAPTAGCTYDGEDATSPSKVVVSVRVYPNARAARFAFDEVMRRNDYSNVSGLGDRAFVPIEDSGDFDVLVGAYWLTVSVERARYDEVSSDDDALARKLVELAVARLPT